MEARLRRSFAAFVFTFVVLATPAAAQESTTLSLPGLDQEVEILVDRWGISHIYAETEHDLFFAQGWNAARDRLFQLELWRRQATGTVARRSSGSGSWSATSGRASSSSGVTSSRS